MANGPEGGKEKRKKPNQTIRVRRPDTSSDTLHVRPIIAIEQIGQGVENHSSGPDLIRDQERRYNGRKPEDSVED